MLYRNAEMRLNQAVMQPPAPHIPRTPPTRPGENRAGAPSFEDLLVAVGKARSRDAFIRLFEHYAPRIKSFLIKGGTDPEQADELAQETMLAVWQRAATYDPAKSGAGTWIYTIARNKRIDALRARTARGGPTLSADTLFALPDTSATQPDDALAAEQESHIVSAAMADLPPEQAEILYKSFFENKTHSEIAAESGIPLGTVKSRIRLALERLRHKLGPENKP
jgi:RNA polymerase sigma-70 factor (ECF subfamily)